MPAKALNATTPSVNPTVALGGISNSMPGMMLAGHDGQMAFPAMGVKLSSFDELPEVMKCEVTTNCPAYTDPPMVDDTRPRAFSVHFGSYPHDLK